MKALNKALFGGTVALVTLSLSPFAGAGTLKTGSKAPDFKATGSDGKTYTLKSFTGKNVPTVLYFIGSSCPVNAEAAKYFNRVAEAYKGQVNFVGVIDSDQKKYKVWQSRFKAPYLVLLDPDMKIIKAYKAERSPWAIMVNGKGEVGKTWTGYSTKQIEELGAAIASTRKIAAKKLDVTGAPSSPRTGCPFQPNLPVGDSTNQDPLGILGARRR